MKSRYLKLWLISLHNYEAQPSCSCFCSFILFIYSRFLNHVQDLSLVGWLVFTALSLLSSKLLCYVGKLIRLFTPSLPRTYWWPRFCMATSMCLAVKGLMPGISFQAAPSIASPAVLTQMSKNLRLQPEILGHVGL